GILESELFGHERGAFSGAIASRKGRFELADGGSLFIDEIGELPPQAQVKLLRFLQNQEFERVGGSVVLKSNARIIVATNRDLKAMVRTGAFREDLFYRLNVIPITLPALRERHEDIPLLARHFLVKYAGRLSKDVTSVSPEAMLLLEEFNWPGNIRQLENTIERAVALCGGSTIETADLPRNIVEYCPEPHEEEYEILLSHGVDLERKTEALERSLIAQALAKTHYSQKRAAQLLNLPVRSLRYRLKKYGMSPSGREEGTSVEEAESVTQRGSSK
ncbi:MAG: sigma-54-dependent Fis family transcriptional regulator, partial [Candidatus Krumholzibacteria bacterium]|nr:sigma-54-dependent Fis family transcriptional regulator [Candidatus Krumholzibacteria bacterium]